MSLQGQDPMEALVGLALRVLVAAVVLGVAFQVCELMGPIARAIACACGVAVMVSLPLMTARMLLGPGVRLDGRAKATLGVLFVTLAVPLVALGMGGSLNGGSAAVMVLVPEVAFLASLGSRPGAQ